MTLLAIEGYTQREIARKMHCSQNTIFKRLIRLC
ncbi:sigma factor-like helix-turn-helix DNA-binding protein [Escherichia coli]